MAKQYKEIAIDLKNDVTKTSQSVFEQLKHHYEIGNEYWTAQKLAKVRDYTDYLIIRP